MPVFKGFLLLLTATVTCALLLAWLAHVARGAGVAVPDGLVRGLIIGLGIGLGQYFLRSRGRR